MRFMPKLGVMHVMTSSSERAHYRWGIGMCEIEHVSQGILDESTARRVEEERVAGCQEHDGTVLHLIPKDIDVFDEEVLAYWMTDEATRGIVARAAVVPVGLTALRHRIRWMFYSQDVAFRECSETNKLPKVGCSTIGSNIKSMMVIRKSQNQLVDASKARTN